LEGVAVRNLRGDDRHGFRIEASADQIVIASGGYQVPMVPRCAEQLPADIAQIHSSLYRNPEQLPPGAVRSSAAGSPAARSPKICTSRAIRCISVSATRRGWRAATAARTLSNGCI
jgi:hypothetical protein